MDTLNHIQPVAAGIPEKWFLVIEGFNHPGAKSRAEKNWLKGYVQVYPDGDEQEFELPLLCTMDLAELHAWLCRMKQSQGLIPDFLFMDAYHRFKHLRRGKYVYISYIYDEFPLQRVHISFTPEEIFLLSNQLRNLADCFPILEE